MRLVSWILITAIITKVLCFRQFPNDLSKIYKARMGKKAFEQVKNLHMNWYIYAIKALFGQIGKELYQGLNKEKQMILMACLDNINDECDLAEGAKCLVRARKEADINESAFKLSNEESSKSNEISSEDEHLTSVGKNIDVIVEDLHNNDEIILTSQLKRKYRKYFKRPCESKSFSKSEPLASKQVKIRWKNNLLQSKHPVKLNKTKRQRKRQCFSKLYCLADNNGKKSTKFDKMEKHIKVVIPESNEDRNKYEKWREKRSPYRLVASEVMKSDSHMINVKRKNMMPPLLDPKHRSSAIQQAAKFIRVMLRGKTPSGNWTATYERIREFKKKMDERSQSRGAKVYEMRLFDLVLGKEKPTKSKSQGSYKDYLSMAFDFVHKLKGTEGREDLNFRFLSPRIMPIMPDKIETRQRVLSPSVLSFYNDDSPDSIASLPKVLENTGMSKKDRQAVLEMVMDVSGAKKAVEMGLNVLEETNFFNMEGEFIEVTNRLMETFKTLEKSFDKRQMDDIDRKGYTFLEVPQIERVLKSHGVKHPKDVQFNVEAYKNVDASKREEMLWMFVENVAHNGTKMNLSSSMSFQTMERNRTKREAISVLSPTVLAPFIFSPIFGVSILGPVVLSPSLFSPLLLNPSVLGPYVMSPAIVLPFIVSPYILSPYVLSPIIMAPFILNPYILSPNVLNPYLLSPLVLSPAIICPDVISPQALGGQILSPTVFSPSIFTESVIMASVLSPTWMS